MGGMLGGGGGSSGGGGGKKNKGGITNTPTGLPSYMPPVINPAGASAELAALQSDTRAATARTLLTYGALGSGAAGLPQVLG